MTSKSQSQQDYTFQSSSQGVGPKASMTETVLCMVCYPSKSKYPKPLTSHHPRGRYPLQSKSDASKTMKVCTRHMKALLAGKDWKLEGTFSKALSKAKRAKSSKTASK